MSLFINKYTLLLVTFVSLVFVAVYVVNTELERHMEQSRTINNRLNNPNYKYSPKVDSLSGILFMRLIRLVQFE